MKSMDELGRLSQLSQQYGGQQPAPMQAPQPQAGQAQQVMTKASPAEAGYQGADQGPFACANCAHFDGKAACELVDGAIDPQGCCNLFSKED